MLEKLYIRFFPLFAKIQLGALVVSSIVAIAGLWLAPLATGLKNLDPVAAKTIAISGVSLFGAIIPFIFMFTKTSTLSSLKLVVYTLAGVSHGLSLSPYLATPVQAAASFLAAAVCTLLAAGQVLELQGSILANDPKSKF
ncbi:hypothetical protein [Sinomonas terrae]|uniref:Uncharacterized protein n=1 Tax=Sinomonas terrae TaxID=2908838 RepID=A0ABS9TWD0_9MICC|nr:hypothetical protein [Sinomonas terrae]MCH6468729.1 hypothetical protein [Sinomonas terrae]